MKFLADENVARELVVSLRQEGHEVTYIVDLNRGVMDDELLQQARSEEAILITADHDFGEMVFRYGQTSCGVILLRLFGLSQAAKTKIVIEVIKQYGHELPGNFTVILPGMIRIRKPL